MPGVSEVASGYAGGASANLTYEDHEGHIEAVEITFDPGRVRYGALVRLFLRPVSVTDAGGQFCGRDARVKALWGKDAAFAHCDGPGLTKPDAMLPIDPTKGEDGVMAGYRLYGRRQTGSMAVEAALAEIGVAHDLVEVARPDTDAARAEFAAINPRLQVPVLIHPGNSVLTEGPAILVHLADAVPEAGLIPPPGTLERATHDRWLAFLHANVYEGMLRESYPDRYTSDPEGAEGVRVAAVDYVRQHFRILEGALGQGPYLLGDAISVFDIYLWMLCYWTDANWLKAECPRIHTLWQTTSARPHLARIGAKHFG